MKKTIKEIQLFSANAQNFLAANPKPTKLSYALKKKIAAFKPHLEEFGEAQEDANVDFAMTDKDGGLVMDENRYKFTPENYRKKLAKVRELQNEVVEFEPHYAPRPENLGELESLVFEDFVIAAEVEPDAEAEVDEHGIVVKTRVTSLHPHTGDVPESAVNES